MKISQLYSHLNGLEYLMVHKPALWSELQAVIQNIDASRFKTKASEEIRTSGRIFYSPVALNREFKQQLNRLDWQESRVAYYVTQDHRLIRKTIHMLADQQREELARESAEAIYSYNQTDFVKERVAVEVQFGKYSFVAYDLFVKHLAFYVGDQIDVGIEILPMKAMQREMSSGVAYYESEVYNVIRNGRGVPAVPLVVIGLEP